MIKLIGQINENLSLGVSNINLVSCELRFDIIGIL